MVAHNGVLTISNKPAERPRYTALIDDAASSLIGPYEVVIESAGLISC